MKKILFVILSVLSMSHVFSQEGELNANVGNEVNIRFGNKKKQGYFNTTQISLLMGNRQITERVPYYPISYYLLSSSLIPPYYYNPRFETEMQVSPSVTMTNGYMFNEHWTAGVGIGFEMFSHHLFPVFADIRYTLWDNKVSPFFAVKTGYAIGNLKKKHYDNLNLNFEPYYVYDAYLRNSGGLMLHPEMGVKVPLSENADLLFLVAFRYQKIKSKVTQTYDLYYNVWEHKESLNRLLFGIAIMFR